MSAAGQRDRGRAELDEECGGEVLVVEERDQVVVHAGRDRRPVLPRSGRLTERADDPGGLLDGMEPFPFSPPTMKRVWPSRHTSYRSPPTVASSTDERYRAAARAWSTAGGAGEGWPSVRSRRSRRPGRTDAHAARARGRSRWRRRRPGDIEEDKPLLRVSRVVVVPAGPSHEDHGGRGERGDGRGRHDRAREQRRQAEKGVRTQGSGMRRRRASTPPATRWRCTPRAWPRYPLPWSSGHPLSSPRAHVPR